MSSNSEGKSNKRFSLKKENKGFQSTATDGSKDYLVFRFINPKIGERCLAMFCSESVLSVFHNVKPGLNFRTFFDILNLLPKL